MNHPIHKNVDRRRIFLVRHSEAINSGSETMSYSSEIPLTEQGRNQAVAMGEYLSGIDFDIVLSSHYLRAVQTAQIILKDKAEMLKTCQYMREIVVELKDLLDGCTSVEDAQKCLAEFPWHIPKKFKAEVETAIVRVKKTLDLLMETNWNICLLIAHGGFNRIFICHLLGIPVEYMPLLEQDYCCLSILDIDVGVKDKKFIRAVLRELNVTPYNHAKNGSLLTDAEKLAIETRPLLEKLFT